MDQRQRSYDRAIQRGPVGHGAILPMQIGRDAIARPTSVATHAIDAFLLMALLVMSAVAGAARHNTEAVESIGLLGALIAPIVLVRVAHRAWLWWQWRRTRRVMEQLPPGP